MPTSAFSAAADNADQARLFTNLSINLPKLPQPTLEGLALRQGSLPFINRPWLQRLAEDIANALGRNPEKNLRRHREAAILVAEHLLAQGDDTYDLLNKLLLSSQRHKDQLTRLHAIFTIALLWAQTPEREEWAVPAFKEAFAELDTFMQKKAYLIKRPDSIFSYAAAKQDELALARLLENFLPYAEVQLRVLTYKKSWSDLGKAINWTEAALNDPSLEAFKRHSWYQELRHSLKGAKLRLQAAAAPGNYSPRRAALILCAEGREFTRQGKYQQAEQRYLSLQKVRISPFYGGFTLPADRPLLLLLMGRRLQNLYQWATAVGLNSKMARALAINEADPLIRKTAELSQKWCAATTQGPRRALLSLWRGPAGRWVEQTTGLPVRDYHDAVARSL